MSRSDEARIAEAVAALTARLTSWGIDDAAEKAHQFVTDMLHQGWRPRALPSLPPPVTTRGTDQAAEYAKACRAEIARARATSKETRDE